MYNLPTAPEKGNLLSTSDNSERANFARKGVFDVLLGNPDPTGGARRWDGVDFLAFGLQSRNGTPHNKFEEFSKITISDNIFQTYRDSLQSKYSNRVGYPAGKGKMYFDLPAAVFRDSQNWRTTPTGNQWGQKINYFEYATGQKNRSALTATATAGYSIFWACQPTCR